MVNHRWSVLRSGSCCVFSASPALCKDVTWSRGLKSRDFVPAASWTKRNELVCFANQMRANFNNGRSSSCLSSPTTLSILMCLVRRTTARDSLVEKTICANVFDLQVTSSLGQNGCLLICPDKSYSCRRPPVVLGCRHAVVTLPSSSLPVCEPW